MQFRSLEYFSMIWQRVWGFQSRSRYETRTGIHPVVERRFVDEAELPLLIHVVASTGVDGNTSVVEIRFEAPRRVRVNDVLEFSVVSEELIALHAVASEKRDWSFSCLWDVPAWFAMLDSDVALPAEREKLCRLRLQNVGGAVVQPDILLFAVAQRIDAVWRIGEWLDRAGCKVWTMKFESN